MRRSVRLEGKSEGGQVEDEVKEGSGKGKIDLANTLHKTHYKNIQPLNLRDDIMVQCLAFPAQNPHLDYLVFSPLTSICLSHKALFSISIEYEVIHVCVF